MEDAAKALIPCRRLPPIYSASNVVGDWDIACEESDDPFIAFEVPMIVLNVQCQYSSYFLKTITNCIIK